MTIQQFYRPGGDSTQNRGVVSDIELPSQTSHWPVGESDLDYALKFDSVLPLPHENYPYAVAEDDRRTPPPFLGAGRDERPLQEGKGADRPLPGTEGRTPHAQQGKVLRRTRRTEHRKGAGRNVRRPAKRTTSQSSRRRPTTTSSSRSRSTTSNCWATAGWPLAKRASDRQLNYEKTADEQSSAVFFVCTPNSLEQL